LRLQLVSHVAILTSNSTTFEFWQKVAMSEQYITNGSFVRTAVIDALREGQLGRMSALEVRHCIHLQFSSGSFGPIPTKATWTLDDRSWL
jgi:hypothetical protein